MNKGVRFNPLAPAFLADPYPEYRRLREEDPVHWSMTGSWILTRHDDIKAALADPRFRTVDTPERVIERGRSFARSGPNLDHLNRFMRSFFIFADPPAHAQFRSPVRAAFSAFAPATLTRLIGAVIDELLEALSSRDQVDLVHDYAEPLACRTIGRIMGLPDADAARIQTLSHRIAPVLDSMIPLEHYRDMNEAVGEMLAFFEEALARAGSDNRFLHALRDAAVDEATRDSLAPIAAGVFFAGQETTINALANGIHLLGTVVERSALAGLSSSPAQANWVQEILRYESPVQLTAREALIDLDLRGRSVKAGQRVVLYLGAANRDPVVFADPDRLDPARDARAHLAFGAGIHRCIGAHIATEEMRQGLPALFERFPRLRLVHAEPRWRKHVTMRGHAELIAELQPGSTVSDR